MKIGLTYDLRQEYLDAGYTEEETAEFDRPDTVEAIESALRRLGHQTDRIGHVRQLAARLTVGDRWDLVFNICEGLHGMAREAQVPALLEAYNIACTFSDPLRMALCLHKGMTKTVVRAAGVATPDFAVIEQVEDLEGLSLGYPLFAKPVAEGTGKGVSPASTARDPVSLREVCAELLARHRQAVLVEEYLPGREFTVGLLGSDHEAEVLGTLEVILRPGAEPDVYSYVNKEHCENLVAYPLVRATEDETVRRAEAMALKAWRALGCRDGGRIDLRCDRDGNPLFLEANPLAGLHPSHSDLPMLCTALDMPYVELIQRIVASASRRVSTTDHRLAGCR
jgi:D-alanine-D-alanine ligase